MIQKKKLYYFLISLALLGVLPMVSSLGVYPTIDPTVKLYWHLNNNATIGENITLVVDSSTGGNNGSIINATANITGGFFSDGDFFFNNTIRQSIATPDHPSNINFSQPFTASVWFRTYTVINMQIFGSYIAQTGNRSWTLEIQSNKVRIGGSADGVSAVFTTGTTNIGNNSDYILATGTWNGTNLLIYVNGVLDSTTQTALASINNSPVPFEVARARNLGFFNGSIDEVILWNRSLSSKEVWALYHTYYGCITPVNTQKIPGNTTLCPNSTYYLNGSGSVFGSGALAITGDNVILSGSNVTLVGNASSPGISGSAIINFTVSNMRFTNYNRTIFLQNVQFANITRLTLDTLNDNAILLRNATRCIVSYNNITGGGLKTGVAGVNIDNTGIGISNGNNITYNTISRANYGIFLNGNVTNSTVHGNVITNSTSTANLGYGITTFFGAEFNSIYNNTILYTAWNGIDLGSSNNNVSSNYISFSDHNGIDLYTPPGFAASKSNSNFIGYNTINNTVGAGILVETAHSNTVRRNLITNNFNSTDGYGIIVEGNGTVNFNNTIDNNTISNHVNALFASSNRSVFSNNILLNISTSYFKVRGFFANTDIDTSTFFGTSIQTSILQYDLLNGRVNVTIYPGQLSVFINATSYSGSDIANVALLNISNPRIYNGTLTSGTSITNTAANLSLAPGAQIYVS